MKTKTLKPYNQTDLVQDSREGKTTQTKYYELGGRKFRIYYENSNGYPMGFNSKMCLSQYDPNNAKWNNLDDISKLNMVKAPNYFSMSESKKHMDEFFTKMEKHLIAVYS